MKLRFRSPLHVGEQGLGLEEVSTMVHSDTLYGAIYSLWCQVYGPPEGNLPLRLSSAFPYLEDEYYYPKPNLPVPALADPDVRSVYGKGVKRTSFVPENLFLAWIRGADFSLAALEESQERLKGAIKKLVRPRVSLDRVRLDSAYYQVGELHFSPDRECGLYFLLETETDTAWRDLKPVLNLLGEQGLGGERSLGYGRFTPTFIEDYSCPRVEGGQRYLTLSLVYPAGPEETAGSLVYYRLLERGGWINSPGGGGNFRTLRVNMLAEGSIFSRPLEGKVIDVAPADFSRRYHPVYRYGRSFLLRVK